MYILIIVYTLNESMNVEYWVEFFHSAGIEPEVAASYANTFFVNKIQLNHLPDIDRDALREMNITPMGDIFTILRYIKRFQGMVTTAKLPAKEEPLNYQSNYLNSSEQPRSIAESKTEYYGENQLENGESCTNAAVQSSDCPQSGLPSLTPSAYQNQLLPSASTNYLCSSEMMETTCALPQMSPVSPDCVYSVNHHAQGKYNVKNAFMEELCSSMRSETNDCERSSELLVDLVDISEPCERSETTDCVSSTVYNKQERYEDSSVFRDIPEDEHCAGLQPVPFTSPIVPNESVQCNTSTVTPLCRPLTPSLKCGSNKNLVSDTTEPTVNRNFGQARTPAEAGGDTPHKKQSVFYRLGEQPAVEVGQQERKSVFSRLGQSQHYHKRPLNLKNVPHRKNGFIRNNPSIKEKQVRPVINGRINNNDTEDGGTSMKGSRPLSAEHWRIPGETFNGDTNKEFTLLSTSSSNKPMPKYCASNNQKPLGSFSNVNLSDERKIAEDKSFISHESNSKRFKTVRELKNCSSSSSRISPHRQVEKRISIPRTHSIRKLHQEMDVKDPVISVTKNNTVLRIKTSSCYSNTLDLEDTELKGLRDPTQTQHPMSFYLAWTDRRKHAYSFPGTSPSFL